MNNKSTMLIVVAAAIIIAGCSCENGQYRIKCSDGFDTGIQGYAKIEEGVVYYRKNHYQGLYDAYRMNPGESCDLI